MPRDGNSANKLTLNRQSSVLMSLSMRKTKGKVNGGEMAEFIEMLYAICTTKLYSKDSGITKDTSDMEKTKW